MTIIKKPKRSAADSAWTENSLYMVGRDTY